MFHQPEVVEVAVVARFAGGETMILPLRAAELTVTHHPDGRVEVEARGWPEDGGWRVWRPEDGSPVPERQGQIGAPQGALTEGDAEHGR